MARRINPQYKSKVTGRFSKTPSHPGSGKAIFREDLHITQNLNKHRMIGKPLKEKVEEAAQIAREIAPVKTGAYRDGILTDQVLTDGKWITRLVGSDFKSGWIEFGTKRMPAFATLRTAMEAAGLHVIANRER